VAWLKPVEYGDSMVLKKIMPKPARTTVLGRTCQAAPKRGAMLCVSCGNGKRLDGLTNCKPPFNVRPVTEACSGFTQVVQKPAISRLKRSVRGDS
jgi:hypothetical protein